MNPAIKYVLSRIYQPIVKGYLSKTRTYRYGKIRLRIPKEVFHPGLFRSTKILLKYIRSLDLQGRAFLELGAGSGLISFVAVQAGAFVTASDINETAITFLRENSKANTLSPEIIHSDLFDAIPPRTFDIIAINPPYYKRDPVTAADHAWYCGTDGQYFKKLFRQLGAFIHKQSLVLMVLSDECDLPMIRSFAANEGYQLGVIAEKNVLGEQLFIFKLEMAASAGDAGFYTTQFNY